MPRPLARSNVPLLALFAAALAVGGCGFGTAGIVAGSSGGGSSNAPATPTTLQLLSPNVSPTTIRLELVDAEADSAVVTFYYVLPGQPETRMTTLADNPVTLAASRDGVPHLLPWDFAAEPGIGDTAFRPDVEIVARVRNGFEQRTRVALGNDPPAVRITQPQPGPGTPTEVSGIAVVRLEVADTTGDRIDVTVGFAVVDATGAPVAAPRTARPAGLDPGDPTPAFAFRAISPIPAGVPLAFFWETTFPGNPQAAANLPGIERPVLVTVTATDSAGATGSVQFPLRVDNNLTPTAQLGADFVVNPDDRRGIPIPVRVVDPESDPVRLVFQWRSATQPAFPDLGTSDPDVLAGLLQDPQFLREKQICRPVPAYASGRAEPVGNDQLRLPELSAEQSRLLAGGLIGRTVELLRNAGPVALAATWPSNPLVAPVACAPLGDGTRALVLDAPAGTARLIELDLASGAIARAITDGLAGAPTALAVEGDRALVATNLTGTWNVFAVDLQQGTATLAISAAAGGAGTPPAPLRGLVRRGDGAAIATAGDALLLLDWSSPSQRVVRLATGLQTPWGVAPDPLRPGHVLVAERGADRIRSFDPTDRQRLPTPVSGATLVPQPTALAVQRVGQGARLLVLCEPDPSSKRVRAIDLGQGLSTTAVELLTVAPEAAAVAAGGAGLIAVTRTGASADLVVSGGIEQTHPITAFDAADRRIAVATPFAPPAQVNQPWRIDVGAGLFQPVPSAPSGRPSTFVWDTLSLGYSDAVQVRVIPTDTEAGLEGTSASRSFANFDAVDVTGGNAPRDAVVEDLDGDGLLDFAFCNRDDDSLRVEFQTAPRQFTAVDVPIASGANPAPLRLVALDADGDGDQDLAFVRSSNEIGFAIQTSPRVFSTTGFNVLAAGPEPDLVAADFDGDGRTDLATSSFTDDTVWIHPATAGTQTFAVQKPSSLAAGDIDGDGDVDLVVARFTAPSLPIAVLRQTTPGTFVLQDLTPSPGVVRVAIADVDADSRADLVCGVFSTGVRVLLQETPGAFTALADLSTGSQTATGIPDVLAVDLDDDGDVDIAAPNRGTNSLSIFLQTSPGAFATKPFVPVVPGPNALAAGDLDGDGRGDLVAVGDGAPGRATVLFSDAARTFRGDQSVPTGLGPNALATADLDGDGDLDIATADDGAQTVTVLLQNAPRSFVTAATLPTDDANPANLVAVDLDGDGDVDIVTANKGGSLSAFRQDAPGVFARVSPPPYVGGGEPTTPAAADLDDDGRIDLVVANSGNDTVTVLYQTPSGTFAANGQAPLAPGSGPAFVTIADLDGDEAPDLIVSNRTGNTLAIHFRSNGQYATAPDRVLTVGAFPGNTVAADLDADGRLDVLCANENSNTVSTFLQSSAGTFVAQPTLPVGDARPSSLRVADLDGDGDLDLATCNYGTAGGSLTVWYQDAQDGPMFMDRFVRRISSGLPTGQIGLLANDLDGDGDPDLAFVNRNASFVQVRWGRNR